MLVGNNTELGYLYGNETNKNAYLTDLNKNLTANNTALQYQNNYLSKQMNEAITEIAKLNDEIVGLNNTNKALTDQQKADINFGNGTIDALLNGNKLPPPQIDSQIQIQMNQIAILATQKPGKTFLGIHFA